MNPTKGIFTRVRWLCTASGHPISGTFVLGDTAVDSTGMLWACTASGTPGTWSMASSIGPGAPMWPSVGSGNKTIVLPTKGAQTSSPAAPPDTWSDTAIQAGLAAEGLFFSRDVIRGWRLDQRVAVREWLAEAPLRETDFGHSHVPYPVWLDKEIQDEAPPC